MPKHSINVIIIGGGAAGFFTAINVAEKMRHASVTILEKSSQTLSKVKISGGGRCNVTNERHQPAELVPYYPRGRKKMYSVFKAFSTDDMRQWLEQRGIRTVAESDQRVFPVSNSSQTIIDCFHSEVDRLGIQLKTSQYVTEVSRADQQWEVHTPAKTYLGDYVVIATGASSMTWKMTEKIGFKQVSPVPSLFTFNCKDPRLAQLQGVSFDHVGVKVVKTKLAEQGPMLITHWGLSGPAILKLSSVGAIDLHSSQYRFDILVNFLEGWSEAEVRAHLQTYVDTHPKRLIHKYPLWELPRRFWERMLDYCKIGAEVSFGQMSKKAKNKLIEELTQGKYEVDGKSVFKEEFVTAGGVDLSEIDFSDFSAKRFPGLYLAGEVLNIDALTGGFNFQACWSAGWLISEGIAGT